MHICVQVSRASGTLQIGNSSVLQADVQAANGVLHLIDSFPLINAAYNTSMIASLEAAGDFGPFNDSQVHFMTLRCMCHTGPLTDSHLHLTTHRSMCHSGSLNDSQVHFMTHRCMCHFQSLQVHFVFWTIP